MSEQGSEDKDLDYTRDIRKRLADSLTRKGMPSDIKEQSILLQTLDGIDRAALGKLRIKSDEGVSSAQMAAASILATLFNDPRTKGIGKNNDLIGDIPTFDVTIEPPLLIEGELDTSPPIQTFESFSLRNQNTEH